MAQSSGWQAVRRRRLGRRSERARLLGAFAFISMDRRSILHSSTIAAIRRYVNIVVHAFAIALAWSVLFLIGLGLNWLMNTALEVFGAPESLKSFLSQIVFAYILISGLMATLTGLKDMWDLMTTGLRKRAPASSKTGDRDEDS